MSGYQTLNELEQLLESQGISVQELTRSAIREYNI
jgi:hypothetical protein